MRLMDAEREAYWRGVRMALSDQDVRGSWPRVSPLSGEWAGESVIELLGDLIDAVADGENMESDWDVYDVQDALCETFEQGYAQAFPDVTSSTYSVCVDCYYVLHNGMDQYVSESVDQDETRERPAGVFPFDVADVADALDYGRYADASFSRHACECCGSTLGGDRFDVRVWEQGARFDVRVWENGERIDV